jgi:hypothetical protein
LYNFDPSTRPQAKDLPSFTHLPTNPNTPSLPELSLSASQFLHEVSQCCPLPKVKSDEASYKPGWPAVSNGFSKSATYIEILEVGGNYWPFKQQFKENPLQKESASTAPAYLSKPMAATGRFLAAVPDEVPG